MLFTCGMFFQIQLDHFVPMEGALFVQQLRTKKTALRISVQRPPYQDISNEM